MTCAIMQPTYLPWLGYFDLIDQVNYFIFLDNVQLVKRSWQVRNRINTTNGELFLTIPIKKTSSRDESLIKDAVFDTSEDWKKSHLKSIAHAYSKAPHFSDVYEMISQYYNDYSGCSLSEFNIGLVMEISRRIGIQTKFEQASKIEQLAGKKDTLLSMICSAYEARVYLSPLASSIYIEAEIPGGVFSLNDISLYYHNFEHPIYQQMSKQFTPYMCILDLLFNEGFNNSIEIIRSGRKQPIFSTNIPQRQTA